MFFPSPADARQLHEFDRSAFGAASGFEALDLSPVCPSGTHRVLGSVHQNNTLATIRNADVLGDATTAMAIESALRRRALTRRADSTAVRLCASHRVVRLQPFDAPGYTPHFRLFSLVSAGRDTGSHAFEMQHLREHIEFYLRLFRLLSGHGLFLGTPRVEISDMRLIEDLLARHGITRDQVRQHVRAHLTGASERFLAERAVTLPSDVIEPPDHRLSLVQTRVFHPLRGAYPEATFHINLARLEGLGYYPGLCLRISPATAEGTRYPIVDGGFTDWTARLLENRKERLLATGIGSEFACKMYRLRR